MSKEWTAAGKSSPRKKREANDVLLVNLGREHDDTEQLAETLKNKHGFNAKRVNLEKEDFSKIDFSQVAAIDLKDLRGWQANHDFYEKQMEVMAEKIGATGRKIPIINPPEMFNWIGSKEYMKELKNKDIPIIPTTFLHRADPMPDIFAMMDKNPDKRVVLKPARGARNDDIWFITKKSDDAFEVTCPQPSTSSKKAAKPHVITYTRENLLVALEGYKEKLYLGQRQQAILIQEYYNAPEISAVCIGHEVHYIERTRDKANLVAHEDFGGTNHHQLKPAPEVVALAEKVREALPEKLRNMPYMRIDILHDATHPPCLLEVEASSVRLFLLEANKVGDYANMINEQVLAAERVTKIKRPDGDSIINSL